MYDEFYGFTSEPFRLSPDAHFCYRHRGFSKAKSYFNYALHHGEGFVLVTGRPGTGKTTLIEDLLKDLADTGILTVRVDSAQVRADDLLRRVAYAFGLEGSGVDKATLLHRLEHYLHQRVRENGKALLIVDEAQALPADALEELRLITNLTNYGRPLVQIFLVGQEALRDTISDPALEQLHQRILCACHLNPLPLQEMRDYLAHRLQCAGWHGDPIIETGAIRALHRGSGGIPRLINKLADRLLLHGGLEEKHELTAADAEYVLHELRAELLLKEDSLPVREDAETGIQIEDIRLPIPVKQVSRPEDGQPSEPAAMKSERSDTDVSDGSDALASVNPEDPQMQHSIADPLLQVPRTVQELPTAVIPIPGGFTEPIPREEGKGVEAQDQDADDIPTIRLTPTLGSGGIDPDVGLESTMQPLNTGVRREPIPGGGDGEPASVRFGQGHDTRGLARLRGERSVHAPAKRASETGPSHRRGKASRRNRRRGTGVMFAIFLLTLLGGGLLLLRGEGARSVDGVGALWPAMWDRLQQISGRKVRDDGEGAVVENSGIQGARQPLVVGQDSEHRDVSALSASLRPTSDEPPAHWMADYALSEGLPAMPPGSEEPLPGVETDAKGESSGPVDTVAQAVNAEAASTVPYGIVLPGGSEPGAAQSADGIPKVSIASSRGTETIAGMRAGGRALGIDRSEESGLMDLSEREDRDNSPDEAPAAEVISAMLVPQVTQPDLEQSPSEPSVGPAVSGDASPSEFASPASAEPAESELASVLEAVQALGVETESVEPDQIRLILRNAVEFDFDSARVPADSFAILDRLAAVFVEHGDVRARIVGHTDHIGDSDYNRVLSARRATAIQRYLVSRGVSADRLSSSGQGEDQPLVPQPSPGDELSRDDRIANRRIELWVEAIEGD